jgi:hypothetical protein
MYKKKEKRTIQNKIKGLQQGVYPGLEGFRMFVFDPVCMQCNFMLEFIDTGSKGRPHMLEDKFIPHFPNMPTG